MMDTVLRAVMSLFPMRVAVFGPLAILAVLYVTTAILTEVISNNAFAVILFPHCAVPCCINKLFNTNRIPDKYHGLCSWRVPFSDYTRVGGPLNLVFRAVGVLLMPMMWPF